MNRGESKKKNDIKKGEKKKVMKKKNKKNLSDRELRHQYYTVEWFIYGAITDNVISMTPLLVNNNKSSGNSVYLVKVH